MTQDTGLYSGKVVIVTGSSSGIGRAAAIKFAEEGASVTIHGQSTERLQETKNQLLKAGATEARILIVQGALDDPKTIDALIEDTVSKFGCIDVLVNNAGVAKHPQSEVISSENFDYVFGINVKAPMLLTEKAALHLEKTRGNVIVISSGLSVRTTYFVRDEYGYNLDNLRNVIFTNGKLDPWSGGCITSAHLAADAKANGVYVYNIDGAAHHLDLREPNTCDPEPVKAARYLMVGILKCWLGLRPAAECAGATKLQWALPPFSQKESVNCRPDTYPWGQKGHD